MSSNERFTITVRGFDTPDTGRLLLGALQRELVKHGFARDVYIDLMGDSSDLRVTASTAHAVIIANASQWRPEFVRQITTALQLAHAGARVEFDWRSS